MGKTAKGKNKTGKKKKGGMKKLKHERLSKVKGTAKPPGRANTW